ncbi:MAG: DGQHR domain-containing protein [Chloroflexota bacterium]|nr:DGQHR domain-containing protein [Chloroflexota bacterium]
MPVETLVRHHFVPRRDTLRDIGYQRLPTASRVNQLASALQKRDVDLPTSVLLSLRDIAFEDVLEHTGHDIYTFRLDPAESEGKHRLFVVDGQHRIAAFEKAIQEEGTDLHSVKIPFVCMIGADESWEMRQFHVVNSNAKSVRTDLALDLLKARSKRDPSFAAWVESSAEAWKIQAQELTERLATASRSWKGKIRLPNSPKAETTVPSASFVQSLRILLTQTVIFRRVKDVEQQGQIIDAYWRAIRRVIPAAFEDPASYNIQKGVGVAVMHSVFPNLLDQARFQGGSLFAPESYLDLLGDALEDLEGLNGAAELVSGADFWKSGRAGAAGAYTSAAGKRRLSEMIEARLPDLEL